MLAIDDILYMQYNTLSFLQFLSRLTHQTTRQDHFTFLIRRRVHLREAVRRKQKVLIILCFCESTLSITLVMSHYILNKKTIECFADDVKLEFYYRLEQNISFECYLVYLTKFLYYF